MNQKEQHKLRQSKLIKNAYQLKTPHVKSMGFRTSVVDYNERESLTNLAELFLINSYWQRNNPEIETSISSYLTDEGINIVANTGQEDLSAYQSMNLPDSTPLDLPLGESIVRRRSTRQFTGDPITANQLATLLRAAAGISATSEITLANGQQIEFNLRTVPSGGGLQPIDIYLAALNITDINPGIYRYQSREDKLIYIGDKTLQKHILASFSDSANITSSNTSLIILYVAKPWQSMRKYGNRGLRFVMHEIGSMSQNLHLSAAALGIGSVDCASFFEQEMNQALNMDGVYQTILHTVLVGVTP